MSESGEGFKPFLVVKSGIENFRNWRQRKTAERAQAQETKRTQESDRLERDKIEVGCVIRSLESAFGVKATDLEWKVKTEDVRRMEERQRKEQTVWNSDAEYFKWLALQNTPLGEALKRHNMERIEWGFQVKEALAQKRIVLLGSHITLPDGRAGHHMAHVKLGDNGQLVLLNDNNLLTADFTDRNYCPSFVFTPKATQTPTTTP